MFFWQNSQQQQGSVGEEKRREGGEGSKNNDDSCYLSEGEKLFEVTKRGAKNEGDALKRRWFVKLMAGEKDVEVFKCKLCRVVMRKEKSEASEGKTVRQESRFKLSVFYSHLIFHHSDQVREMHVSELPVNSA